MSLFAPRKQRPFAERKATNTHSNNRNVHCGTFTMLGNVFDPKAELLILSGVRPHWSQAGAVVFITARLHDSIPSTVLQKWEQCDSWLHYTAVQINRRTGTEGKLWQQEPFDHLVRSPEQYEYLRKYIADNAAKARLPGGSFLYRRYPDQ